MVIVAELVGDECEVARAVRAVAVVSVHRIARLTVRIDATAIAAETAQELARVRLVDVEAREDFARLLDALLTVDVVHDLDVPAELLELLFCASTQRIACARERLGAPVMGYPDLAPVELQVVELLAIARDVAQPVFDVPDDA